MGAAKTEQSNRVIRSSTRRHMQRRAISLVGRRHANKIDQGQGRFLPHERTRRYENKATFKFLDAELIVRRIRPSPKISVAHNEALSKGFLVRYNLTRVELKTHVCRRPSSNIYQ